MYSIDHVNARWTFTQDFQRLYIYVYIYISYISCVSRKNHCFVIGFLRQQLQRLRHQSFQVTMPQRVSPNSSVASRGWAVLLPARMEVACNFPLLWALEWCDVQCVYSTIYIYLVYYLLFVHHALVYLPFFFNTCFRNIFIWVNWSGVSWLQPKKGKGISGFLSLGEITAHDIWYTVYIYIYIFFFVGFRLYMFLAWRKEHWSRPQLVFQKIPWIHRRYGLCIWRCPISVLVRGCNPATATLCWM